MPHRPIDLIKTMAIALLGALAFRWLSLPLPFLLGPMFACLIAALGGVRMVGAGPISNLMRTVLGVAVGASITPELFGRLDTMLFSLALMPVFILAIALVGIPYFRRLGFDGPTAYYATMPGGLQDMLLFGEEAGADVRALSLIHATRVLIIVSVLPMIMTFALGLDLNAAPGVPATELPVRELVLMGIIAIVGWKGGAAIGLFGASILGPLILAAIASLTDVIHHRPPAEAILVAQYFIGFTIGVKYTGVTLRELKRVVGAAIGYVGITSVISVLFAGFAIALNLSPMTEAILAFAPGGQAEMAILAIVSGSDIAFVVAHHLVRIVAVITGAPLFARFSP